MRWLNTRWLNTRRLNGMAEYENGPELRGICGGVLELTLSANDEEFYRMVERVLVERVLVERVMLEVAVEGVVL